MKVFKVVTFNHIPFETDCHTQGYFLKFEDACAKKEELETAICDAYYDELSNGGANISRNDTEFELTIEENEVVTIEYRVYIESIDVKE